MTTSYDLLRTRCNELLPELGLKNCTRPGCMLAPCNGHHGRELTITDVLRALAATRAKATSFYIEDDGNLWQCTAPLGDNLLCKFTLSLPLSAPENEAACEAVLAMLTTNP